MKNFEHQKFDQQKQDRIDKAIKNKERRYSKTELSILVSWAINNAVHTLPPDFGVDDNWDIMQNAIKERYPFFIDLHREWMMDNLPIETITYEPINPFDTDKAEADEKKGDDIAERSRAIEETQRINDNLGAVSEAEKDVDN